MFVKRVYTLLRLSVPQSHCLIVATGDIRRLFGENFAVAIQTELELLAIHWPHLITMATGRMREEL